MFGLEKLEGNQAAQLGLLSAGAAMLDPRGTRGEIGASINKSVQAGLGTYIPMMQWKQNKDDRKQDRDWKKEQDIIRNTLQERQFKLRQKIFESETENRQERTNLERTKVGIIQREAENARKMRDLQMKYMGLDQPATPATPATTNFGPRAGATPPGSFGPRVGQAQPMQAPTSQFDPSPLSGPTPKDFTVPNQPVGQFGQGQQAAPDPYMDINRGQFLGLGGMEQKGKDAASFNQHMRKKLFDHGIDMSKVMIKQDPLGLNYFIVEEGTGMPLGKVNSDMEFTPAPGQAKQTDAIKYEDWLKQQGK